MEEKVQNALQNCSGGILKIVFTILTIIVLVGKIVKFPSTTALKGILNFSSMCDMILKLGFASLQ